MKALYHLSREAYANFLWSVVERIKTPVRQRSSYPLRGKTGGTGGKQADKEDGVADDKDGLAENVDM